MQKSRKGECGSLRQFHKKSSRKMNSLFDQSLFFCQVVWTDFAQILGAIETIEIEDAIEMIDLVLQGPGKEAFCTDSDRLATHILNFHQDDGCASAFLSIIPWIA